MSRPPVSVSQLRESLKRRIHRTKASIETLSLDKNPQVVDMVLRLKGELVAYELVYNAILDRSLYAIDHL